MLVDLELLLTDAFLLLGSHLLAGRVNPETIHTKWQVFNPDADLADILLTAIDTNQIDGALSSLGPPHPGYLHFWLSTTRVARNRLRTVSVRK